MIVCNDNTPTRIDPSSGQGSVLDLAIISESIKSNVTSFKVDSSRKMTPYSMKKRNGEISKHFTDHLAINIKINLPCVEKKESNKKRSRLTDKLYQIIEDFSIVQFCPLGGRGLKFESSSSARGREFYNYRLIAYFESLSTAKRGR